MCSSIRQACVQKLAWPTAPAQQGALFGAGKQLSCHFAACGILMVSGACSFRLSLGH